MVISLATSYIIPGQRLATYPRGLLLQNHGYASNLFGCYQGINGIIWWPALVASWIEATFFDIGVAVGCRSCPTRSRDHGTVRTRGGQVRRGGLIRRNGG